MHLNQSQQTQKNMEAALFHLSYVVEARLTSSEKIHFQKAKETLARSLVALRAEEQLARVVA